MHFFEMGAPISKSDSKSLDVEKIMKNIIIAFLLCMVARPCYASEEDYAAITAIQLEAQTSDNTFGKVNLCATFTNEMEGTIFTSLSVDMKGKKCSVPKDELDQVARVHFSTIRISSEVGYPNRGIGPYLYIRFSGHDGTKQQKYQIIFDSTGFKEMKAKDIQQKNALYQSGRAHFGK